MVILEICYLTFNFLMQVTQETNYLQTIMLEIFIKITLKQYK